jgi:hypothetical protein
MARKNAPPLRLILLILSIARFVVKTGELLSRPGQKKKKRRGITGYASDDEIQQLATSIRFGERESR